MTLLILISLKLGSHWQMTHIEFCPLIQHLNDEKQIPCNTKLESKELLIPKARPIPSSTPFSMISNSLVWIHNANMLKLLMYDLNP